MQTQAKLNKDNGEHKQRVVMYVTLNGIRIVDEKTQVSLPNSMKYHLFFQNIHNSNSIAACKALLMHQSIETPAPRPPGLGGDLTHPKPGFNALLTARWPRWAVDLTNCQ